MMGLISLKFVLASASFWLSLVNGGSASSPDVTIKFFSDDQLEEKIQRLRGDDLRIFRWHAVKHTAYEQRQGACDDLPIALEMIASSGDKVSERTKMLAMDYATFCVTNNRKQRAVLNTWSEEHGRSEEKDDNNRLYKSIAKLVRSTDALVSAKACHLVYIATYTNTRNHQGFIQAGAVEACADVVKRKDVLQVQFMWAAIALGNLGASYCDTHKDGTCYWDWRDDSDALELTEESSVILSDGHAARMIMLNDPDLIKVLNEYVCRGPIHGDETEDNPYPGSMHSQVGLDDASDNIVAWAAAGALKNMALEVSARPKLEDSMNCYCMMVQSGDWLESNKGEGLVSHLRRTDPCWINEDTDIGYGYHKVTCVDKYYWDEEGYDCAKYVDASGANDCKGADQHGVDSKTACCACGGGDRITAHEEL